MKSMWWKIGCALLIFLGIGAGQSGHKNQSLSINGHSGEVIVYQIDHKSYVDLESLVRIGNGSMSFKGDQIILSFPMSDHVTGAHHDSGTNQSRLTPDFQRAGLQTLSVLKDWTNTLSYGIERGVPGDGSRLVAFHDRAADALRLTTVAASSNSDQDALHLLTDQFNTVSQWSDKLVAERRSMNTGKYSISPDGLKNDETYKKISACAAFLNTMLPKGTFHDDYSCR
jgi:hypothetical protein